MDSSCIDGTTRKSEVCRTGLGWVCPGRLGWVAWESDQGGETCMNLQKFGALPFSPEFINCPMTICITKVSQDSVTNRVF